MKFLIDTNIVSEFSKDSPDENVVDWFRDADEDCLFVSAMTVAELRRGIAILAEGQRKRLLDRWLTSSMLPRLSDRILVVDAAVADRWGRIVGTMKRQDATRHAMDAFIAATALIHSLAIVTRNVRDFSTYGVEVIDPFKPSS